MATSDTPTKAPVNGTRAWLAACCWILATIVNLSFLIAGRLGATLPPKSSFVSELSSRGEPASGIFRVTDLLTGILILLAIAFTVQLLPRNRWVLIGLGLLTLAAIAYIVDGIFPLDCAPTVNEACRLAEERNQVSVSHRIHNYSGIIESVLEIFGIFFVGVGLLKLTNWATYARFAIVAAVLLAISNLIIIGQYMAGWSLLGYNQRLGELVICAFMVVTAVTLVRHSRPGSDQSSTEQQQLANA